MATQPTPAEIDQAGRTIDDFLNAVPPRVIEAETAARAEQNPYLKHEMYEKLITYTRGQLAAEPGVRFILGVPVADRTASPEARSRIMKYLVSYRGW